MRYLANAFSLQMLEQFPVRLRVEEIPAPTAEELAALESCVGHADTAAVLGVECRRVSIQLRPGDTLIVAQLTGGRLPEGATTLPTGLAFRWLKVTIE